MIITNLLKINIIFLVNYFAFLSIYAVLPYINSTLLLIPTKNSTNSTVTLLPFSEGVRINLHFRFCPSNVYTGSKFRFFGYDQIFALRDHV